MLMFAFKTGVHNVKVSGKIYANNLYIYGQGNGNPLQYSCLENSMDRGAWQAIVHGGRKVSDMT